MKVFLILKYFVWSGRDSEKFKFLFKFESNFFLDFVMNDWGKYMKKKNECWVAKWTIYPEG